MAADLMMLSGVVLLLKYSRDYVHFSMRRLTAWPSFALVLSTAVAFVPDWSSWALKPWISLVMKCLACGSIYLGTLYLFERQETHSAIRWLSGMIMELMPQTNKQPKT